MYPWFKYIYIYTVYMYIYIYILYIPVYIYLLLFCRSSGEKTWPRLVSLASLDDRDYPATRFFSVEIQPVVPATLAV